MISFKKILLNKPFLNSFLIVAALILLSSCNSYRYKIIQEQNDTDTAIAVDKLNSRISKAVDRGCSVQDISVSTALGIGVGINVGKECDNCNPDKITNTVKAHNNIAAALLKCPKDIGIDH